MARKRKKKALYEVISQSRSRSSIERATQKDTERADTGESAVSDKVDTSVRTQWPRKPKLFQFNAGRVEISMPYQLAVAMLLGIVLLVLVFFRLGQMSYLKNQNSQSGETSKEFEPGSLNSDGEIYSIETRSNGQPKEITTGFTSGVESTGDNVIVIQILKDRTQLEPVKDYYSSLGIETRIIGKNDRYYLVTEKRYDNPDSTAAYSAKQMIIRRGADYKPPPGYKGFGEKPFSDAFFMKIED